MRSSTDYINENDDLVSSFDASTCAGDNVYDIFKMRTVILPRIQLFGPTLIKKSEKGG